MDESVAALPFGEACWPKKYAGYIDSDHDCDSTCYMNGATWCSVGRGDNATICTGYTGDCSFVRDDAADTWAMCNSTGSADYGMSWDDSDWIPPPYGVPIAVLMLQSSVCLHRDRCAHRSTHLNVKLRWALWCACRCRVTPVHAVIRFRTLLGVQRVDVA